MSEQTQYETDRDGEIEAFQRGDCWVLAQALSQLSGAPMVGVGVVGDQPNAFVHALVRLADGRLLDVIGAHTDEDVLAFWEEDVANWVQPEDWDENMPDEIECYLFDLDPAVLVGFEQEYAYSPAEVQIIAARLLSEVGTR